MKTTLGARSTGPTDLTSHPMLDATHAYIERLTHALSMDAMNLVPVLAEAMREAWQTRHNIYFCGNGGSAGNAIHLANDFIYGVGKKSRAGMRVESLSANAAVLTCLGNDIGYDLIYAEQLRVKANPGDVLVVLSGSGNSPNVVRAIEVANEIGMHTFAILGFSGGRCRELAHTPLHFPLDDMQIAEDLQLIIGHMCMQWLCDHPV